MLKNLREKSTLLAIKECDLREDTLLQCRDSADKGLHVGGAFSAIMPLVSLYYGGFMKYDTQNPTTMNQDIFILSKGHAVAALASTYADVGYFEKIHLKGSRGYGSLVKGHPGPTIPGVPVATGPLGHGISVACGYALRLKEENNRNVYTMVGDGELQEGSCWEGIMFAGSRRLNNLCVLVDKNDGQSDNTQKLFIKMEEIGKRFEAFGFRVIEADCSVPSTLLTALERFNSPERDPRPTAIICQSMKGIGGYAANTQKHKASFSDSEIEQECTLLKHTRECHTQILNDLDALAVDNEAEKMGYKCCRDAAGKLTKLVRSQPMVDIIQPEPRDKAIKYDTNNLPNLEQYGQYGATDIAIQFMKTFAVDDRVYSVDADLSNVSGLYDGVRATWYEHALNVGIAECNMMCIAEGLAACGCNVWVSTFGPFFDWQAFRRIAVTYQERMESIQSVDGWLSEGHNLDITFLSTASNLDTGVNGATHMSNDDICVFNQMAHLKVIDVSCPQMFLSVAKWIAQGNRGLVYLRVMRNKADVLYTEDFEFEYNRGYYLRDAGEDSSVIISSGHGVTEALVAAEILKKEGIAASVLDMPSFDHNKLRDLVRSKRMLIFAEQNNGALYDRFCKMVVQEHLVCDFSKVQQLSTLTKDNEAQFIQSGTYPQLIKALGLTPKDIANKIKGNI